MSFEAMTWAVKQKCGSPAAKMVLMILANHTNPSTGQCNPSHKRVAEQCEISISSLKVHIRKLAEAKILTVLHKFSDGVNLPNQYVLNLDFLSFKTDGVGQNLPGGGAESAGVVGQNLATKHEFKTVNETNTPNTEDIGFALFWSIYPKRVSKVYAAKVWKSGRFSKETQAIILGDVEKRKNSEEWLKESMKYAPNPASYLNQRRWEDESEQPQEFGNFV